MNEYIIRCAYCGKSMKANDPCIGEKVSCEDCVIGINTGGMIKKIDIMKNRKFLLHTCTIEDRHKETDYLLEDNSGYQRHRKGRKKEVLKVECEFKSWGKTTKITNQDILNSIWEKLSTIS